MKRILTLAIIITCINNLQAQFVNQLIYKRSFSTHQVDSILQANGVPSGVFPITYGAKAYKIIYNTVDWDSMSTIASGLLMVPINPACKVPLISYQHGTTIKKTDVLSNFSGEWYLGLAGAANGNVMVMPDYLGLGSSPGLHPYQHAHTEATAVIDMIRAAKEVVDTMGAPVNDQLFLFGYSQGGHATMAAHQLIQEKLDNVMHVTASAPMSGAYDMSGVMANLMLSDSTYPEPYYLPYLFFGYNEVYHMFTNDSDVMVYPYDSTLRPLFDGTHNGSQINAAMPQVPKLIMQPLMIDSFRNDSTNFFKLKLKENDTYNWTPNSPIRMYYCQGDHSVPYQNAIVAYQHFIQNGATMVDTVDVNPTLDHYPCAQFAILYAVQWFDSLAYKPMTATVSVVNNSSVSSPNGTATANTTNGSAPFTFLWSNGDTTATSSNLTAGTYTVTITDGSMCPLIDTAVVNLISGLQNEVLTNIKIYPNPSSGKITIENLDPSDNITETELFDISGRLIKTYAVRQANFINLYTDEAAPGVYYLQLKSETGKEVRRKMVVM